MTVRELIEQLSKMPQEALVGCSQSSVNGWVSVADSIATLDAHEGDVVSINCSTQEVFMDPDEFGRETDIEVVWQEGDE